MSIKVRCRLSKFPGLDFRVGEIVDMKKMKTATAVKGVQPYEKKLQRHNI
jgi:hypothetical protein